MAVTYELLWWESTTTELALRSSRTKVAVPYFVWYVASVMSYHGSYISGENLPLSHEIIF